MMNTHRIHGETRHISIKYKKAEIDYWLEGTVLEY